MSAPVPSGASSPSSGSTLARVIYRAAPAFSFLITEILNRCGQYRGIRPFYVLANLLWYLAFYFLASCLSGRHRRLGACVTAAVLFVPALINHYTLRFRGRQLAPTDLVHAGTAANVARSYDLTPDFPEILAIALFILLLWLLIRFPVTGKSVMPVRRKIILSSCLALFFAVFLFTSLPADMGVEAATPATENRGFLNEFFISLRYSILRRPAEYTEELAEDLQEEIEDQLEEAPGSPAEQAASSVRPVNIIVIMNESLADLSIFPGFDCSRDPMPFYHSLEGSCITGYTVSPVYGGGTANAEYEFLTANSCSFLPEGSVAYETYLDSETPSLADFADEQGYETAAFHPFLASSWNREEAYELLGFDRQLYQEAVSDPELIGDYISDACDYRMVEQLTEDCSGSLFLFNVTIQNHGGYESDRPELKRTLTLSQALQEADPSAQDYVNLVRASDRALEELLDYYSSCEEPTLICMFGDHQPSLSDEFYDLLYGKPAEERSGRELLNQYKTPFLIWANYDLTPRSGLTISMPALGILLAEEAGLGHSYYTAMLAEIYEDIPVIHRYGYLTSDGSYAPDRDSLNAARQEMLDSCEILQYHSLFDRETDDEFYLPEDGPA